MNEKDFLDLAIGDYIHSKENGDEWIVEENDGTFVGCKCTTASMDYSLGEFVDFHYAASNYFTKGKIKPISPWISCKDSLPNENEIVLVRLNLGDSDYDIAYQMSGIFYEQRKSDGILEVESWMHIPE